MKATVILPTTSDRGPLLRYSAGSVLRQSVRDVELVIIGDGVDAATRDAANELVRGDRRVRFFDLPKHARRGEPYRDEILRNEAKGEIVCYLCDRDLMFSNHVSETYEALKTNDIVITYCYDMGTDDAVTFAPIGTWGAKGEKRTRLCRLTCVAHTMGAYMSLPHGWRTTPARLSTDVFMWKQFLDQPHIKASRVPVPTVLYFKRGGHPGWSTEARRRELSNWYSKLVAEDGERRIHQELGNRTLQELSEFRKDMLKWKSRRNKRSPVRQLRRFINRVRHLLPGNGD